MISALYVSGSISDNRVRHLYKCTLEACSLTISSSAQIQCLILRISLPFLAFRSEYAEFCFGYQFGPGLDLEGLIG